MQTVQMLVEAYGNFLDCLRYAGEIGRKVGSWKFSWGKDVGSLWNQGNVWNLCRKVGECIDQRCRVFRGVWFSDRKCKEQLAWLDFSPPMHCECMHQVGRVEFNKVCGLVKWVGESDRKGS